MATLEGKHLVVSGPVIIQEGYLITVKDNKDDFYKLPGGSIEKGESLEEACKREVFEEIGGKIEIIRPLSSKVLWENPQTKEGMTVSLTSFLAYLKNPEEITPKGNIKEIKRFDLKKIDEWKHEVSPYTQFLIDKGDIKC